MRRIIGWLRMKPQSAARQKSMPRWLRRGLFAAFIVACVAGYLGGVALLTRSGWIDARLAEAKHAIDQEIADAGFRVQSVSVFGAEKTELSELYRAVGVRKGDPILAIDLVQSKRKIETLPWVRVATVERQLPDVLVVRVAERNPLALWQHKGGVALLDSTGAVVPDAPLIAFSDLPLLAGEGVPAAAADLMALLDSEPDLAPRVTAASYVEERRWDLLLDDRVWVKLPQVDALTAWRRLAHADREDGVLRRNILAVDVRQSENWVFRLPEGARTRIALERNGG